MSQNCPSTADNIKTFLNVQTDTYWEAMAGYQSRRRPRVPQVANSAGNYLRKKTIAAELQMEPFKLKRMICSPCTLVIEAEPDLTKWDTVKGDGDCGQTFKTGAASSLDALDNKNTASRGSDLDVLYKIEDVVETKMGGTLGGLLGIFFVSLNNAILRMVEDKSCTEDIRRMAFCIAERSWDLATMFMCKTR